MICTNTSKVLRVNRERKIGIITNTNDTYEYIKELRVNRERKIGIITYICFYVKLVGSTSFKSLQYRRCVIKCMCSYVRQTQYIRAK